MFALRQYILLLLTAMLWGGGFVGQKLGMDYVSPFTFNFFRTLIGALFLVPVIMIASRIRIKGGSAIRKSSRSDLIADGRVRRPSGSYSPATQGQVLRPKVPRC